MKKIFKQIFVLSIVFLLFLIPLITAVVTNQRNLGEGSGGTGGDSSIEPSATGYKTCNGICYKINHGGGNTGSGLTINGVCYVITNSHALNDYFIPLNSVVEGQAFLDNLPNGVTKTTCASTPTSPPVATVYQDCGYGGYAIGLPVGEYTLTQLIALGVKNDDISSIKINSGYTATLYKDDNFQGTSLSLTSDNSCFTANSFNDVASSIVISRLATSCTKCADENGQCSFTGTLTIFYGAGNNFYSKSLTGGTACTNSVFGDPIQGTVKACYYCFTTAITTDSAGREKVASVGQITTPPTSGSTATGTIRTTPLPTSDPTMISSDSVTVITSPIASVTGGGCYYCNSDAELLAQTAAAVSALIGGDEYTAGGTTPLTTITTYNSGTAPVAGTLIAPPSTTPTVTTSGTSVITTNPNLLSTSFGNIFNYVPATSSIFVGGTVITTASSGSANAGTTSGVQGGISSINTVTTPTPNTDTGPDLEPPTLPQSPIESSGGTASTTCFAAGTSISMADGTFKEIQQISAGDQVISYDETRDKFTNSVVKELIIHDGKNFPLNDYVRYPLVKLSVKVGDRLITTEATLNHPFYDPVSKVFKELKEFKIGDEVKTIGDVGIITNEESLIDKNSNSLQKQTIVYNLEMANGPKNYLANGIVAHNKL